MSFEKRQLSLTEVFVWMGKVVITRRWSQRGLDPQQHAKGRGCVWRSDQEYGEGRHSGGYGGGQAAGRAGHVTRNQAIDVVAT